MQTVHASKHQTLDVKNLCSRKLFELLAAGEDPNLTRQQQHTVEQELLERHHYVRELQHLRGVR